jgi:Flp pilus assembly pilin Flp
MRRRHRNQRGAALVEYALAYTAIILPLTFAIVFTAQLLWIWHTIGEWTRGAARYASTHCWQASAGNVQTWMQTNLPAVVNADQFRTGGADLSIQYFSRDAGTGALTAFSCDSECSTQCVPDTVTVAVRNFQYQTFFTYLGLPPIQMPDFQTSVPIESAGCDPEQGTCVP